MLVQREEGKRNKTAFNVNFTASVINSKNGEFQCDVYFQVFATLHLHIPQIPACMLCNSRPCKLQCYFAQLEQSTYLQGS